jgi:hypothetical protein
MTTMRRTAADLRRLTRAATSVHAAAVQSGELANAASKVIATRSAMAAAAMALPHMIDTTEFTRMVPEKVAAFSAAGAVLWRRWSEMARQMSNYALAETTQATQAASRLASCRNPAEALTIQSTYLAAVTSRTVSRSIAMTTLALRTPEAVAGPVHRAAMGNARRLGV